MYAVKSFNYEKRVYVKFSPHLHICSCMYCLCLQFLLLTVTASCLYSKEQKRSTQCLWRWKLQCRGWLSLFQPTSPTRSSPSLSKSAGCLFPRRLRQTHPTIPLLVSQILCLHCHRLKDAPRWAECFLSINPPGHPCLIPSVNLQILRMIPANSSPTSISALLTWACWGGDHLEKFTRWAKHRFK